MERVRRHVKEIGGTLVAEIPFLDTQPDRSTDAIEASLLKVQKLCVNHGATMLYVNFREFDRGRRNYFLDRGIERLNISAEALSPVPLAIDGKLFNPIHHFANWAKRHDKIADELESRALAGLRSAVIAIDPGRGRYRKIAEWLNKASIATFEGRKWTDENVRKALKERSINGSTE